MNSLKAKLTAKTKAITEDEFNEEVIKLNEKYSDSLDYIEKLGYDGTLGDEVDQVVKKDEEYCPPIYLQCEKVNDFEESKGSCRYRDPKGNSFYVVEDLALHYFKSK